MRKALVVGFNNYEGCPLYGCINDAKKVSSILEYNTDGSKNFDVKLITDELRHVTKAQLKRSIKDLFLGDCDMALLYFSGHGMADSVQGTIVTPDFCESDEGISMNEILGYANESKIKDKVIILDCCHSGSFGNLQGNNCNMSTLSEGLTVLTASRKDEPSVERNGVSIFTELVVEALNGGATDLRGYVTPGKIYSYVDAVLGPWDQRPIFKTNVSRFTVLRKCDAQINIRSLRNIPKYFDSPTDIYKLNPSYEFTEKCHDDNNVRIFKELQKLQSVGLVVPVGEEYMYFAAINYKSCRLTAVGRYYWKLAKEQRL